MNTDRAQRYQAVTADDMKVGDRVLRNGWPYTVIRIEERETTRAFRIERAGREHHWVTDRTARMHRGL